MSFKVDSYLGGQGVNAWDSASKDADITLSGSDLIASTSGAATGSVRAVNGRDASLNVYCEVTIAEPNTDYNARVGLVTSSDDMTVELSTVADSMFIARDGDTYTNGSVTNSDYFPSTTVGVLYDAGTGNITYFRGNGFLDVARTVAAGTTLYPMWGSGTAGAGTRTATLNTGGSAFVYDLPPGATAWGGAWHTTDKNANITLSGSNLIGSITTNVGSGRGDTSYSTGVHYFEITWTDSGGGANVSCGVGTSSATLASWVGSDTHGTGWFGALPNSVYNNGSGSTISKLASYTIGIWLNNGDVKYLDSAGEIGPVAASGLTGTKYPAWGVAASSGSRSGTLNVTGSFVHALPSGASAWG